MLRQLNHLERLRRELQLMPARYHETDASMIGRLSSKLSVSYNHFLDRINDHPDWTWAEVGTELRRYITAKEAKQGPSPMNPSVLYGKSRRVAVRESKVKIR